MDSSGKLLSMPPSMVHMAPIAFLSKPLPRISNHGSSINIGHLGVYYFYIVILFFLLETPEPTSCIHCKWSAAMFNTIDLYKVLILALPTGLFGFKFFYQYNYILG